MENLKRVKYIQSVLAKDRHKGSFCDIYPVSTHRVAHIFKKNSPLYKNIIASYFLIQIDKDLSDSAVLSNILVRHQIAERKHKR